MSSEHSQLVNKMSGSGSELASRIREIRISAFGRRGCASFARELDISPSTYSYYERGRVPPVPLLLKMCEVTGVDLRWLLAGESPSPNVGGPVSPEHARILGRMSALLPNRMEAVGAVNALLDLLEAQPPPTGAQRAASDEESAAVASPFGSSRIPILGRTAAGVPHFWRRPEQSVELFRTAVFRCAGSGDVRLAQLSDAEGAGPIETEDHVHIVKLTKPVRVGEVDITEYLDCPQVANRCPGAFSLRVDGDSMQPSLAHGDLVVLSPEQPAKKARPAVVQLRNQIGVTCKLFYTDKTHVHLIPINEQFQPTRHPLGDLVWALAVLYRVRCTS